MRFHNILFIFLLLGVFTACSPDRKVFSEYHEMEKLSWNRFDIQKFEIDINEVPVTYDLYLAIRHIPEFNLEELDINVAYFMPSGDMRTFDKTIEFIDREDIAKSDCLGDLCDIEFLIREGLTINDAGTLKVEIENKFTKIELPGILEVGFIIRKSKS